MFEEGISAQEVTAVVRSGTVIRDYPEDRPFPSVLMLGFVRGRPIHVVAALDSEPGVCHIVTAYVPDPERWEEDFRTRKRI